MQEQVTVKDMYDMMKSLNDSTKFGIREQTICAMMELLLEEKELFHEPEYYERRVRERVPVPSDAQV